MKKRKAFLLLLCSLTLFVSGCGSQAEVNTENEIKTEEEPVTITYGLWGGESRQAYTMEQIQAFEDKYPYITVDVNYTDWETVNGEIDEIMTNGTQSDLMQINYNWLLKYASYKDAFYDLNQLADWIQLDVFSDLSLSMGQIGGKQYALNVAINTSVPVYNKTMYDYYGLDLPESMDDLYADALVMKEDNVYQLGMPDNQIVLFLFGCYENTFGVSAVDEEGNINLTEEGWSYLANLYQDLQNNYILCPRSQYSTTRIEGNRVAGVVCWLNYIEEYKSYIENAGNEPAVGKFLWSDVTERLGNYYKPSTMLAISANTEHPKETALLLNFLLNDEQAVTLQGVDKGIPDSRTAQQILMEEGNLNNDTYYASLRMNYYLEYMNLIPIKLEENDVITNLLDTLDAYKAGSKTWDETLASLRELE